MRLMILGAVLTGFGALIGYAVAVGIDPLSQATWWDVATAFGTLFATFAAIGIAAWTGFSQRALRQQQDAYESDLSAYRVLSLARDTEETIERFRDHAYAGQLRSSRRALDRLANELASIRGVSRQTEAVALLSTLVGIINKANNVIDRTRKPGAMEINLAKGLFDGLCMEAIGARERAVIWSNVTQAAAKRAD